MSSFRLAWVPLLLVLLAPACRRSGTRALKRIEYPPTRTVDHVDTYHGVKIKDAYRWLEDDNSDETKAWVEAQNEITFRYLKRIRARKKIKARLEELWNYERFSVPFKEGERYFFRRNTGLQNQSVLYTTDSLGGEPRELLDPNTLSEDGTVSVPRLYVSPDGNLMVYSISRAGSDWREFKLRDVASGEDLADHLRWIKFSGASWKADSSGFFYSRMPEPEEGAALTAANVNQKVYFHAVGAPQSDDVLVYERPDDPQLGLYPWVTEDGRYLGIYVSKGSASKNGVYYKDLDEDGPITELIPTGLGQFWPLGNDGPIWFVSTNLDAPRGRIIAIDLRKPARENWTELVPEPEGKTSIEDAHLIGDRFVLHKLRLAHSQITLHHLDGTFDREIDLPTAGSVFRIMGKQSQSEMFFAFSGFTYPTAIYHHDFESGETAVWRRPNVRFNPTMFETRQVSYPSRDTTRVTMFIAHRTGLKRDGTNPTLLYGYGGFNSSMTPWFSAANVVWMEMGGVYAVPNLRGGGEYGEEWHRAGMLERKQNVFDDFIAAAESLIYNGYTSSKKLAIEGGSNGGLLVGACMIQRPELFGACLPSVGVMDMLRFHKFTIGRAWVGEYGSSDDPEMFPVLLRYSPYHNLREAEYPATMVMTADHDDRVVPAHSFKFAARLQAVQKGKAPVLIRIDVKAGHGAGTPTSKRIEEFTDKYAFLVRNLDVKLPRWFR